MSKIRITLFSLIIIILIFLPLIQIFFNIIPSNLIVNNNQIKIIPKSYDGQMGEVVRQTNSNNIECKLEPYIKELLKTENPEESIPLIIFLKDQPLEKIAFQLKYEQNLKQNDEYYHRLSELTKKEIQPSQNAFISEILQINGKIKHVFSIINAISVDLPLKYINFLSNNSNVAKIAYDYTLKADLHDSVPSMTEDPPKYWNYSYNGSNVVVAVMDTGINENHPALVGTVIDRYNAITGGTDAADDFFHGTYVAGIIANRDPYSHGVAYNVSIINVKVLNNMGVGPSSWLMAGVEWVLTRAATKPDIINFSGGVPVSGAYDGLSALTVFVDAITSMYNVLWINAAGNTNTLIELPADAYNSIAVGALYDQPRNTIRNNDFLAGYSSRGPTLDGRIKPDIVALGGFEDSFLMIYSYINSCRHDSNGWRADKTGTSFSAPHISGAAALIYDYLIKNINVAKNYYPLVTKALLLSTADDWSSSGPANDGPDNNTGWGYVNLANTWDLLQSGVTIETNSLSYDNIAYKTPFYYNLTLNKDEILNLTLLWNRHALYLGGLIFTYGNGRPNNLNMYLMNSNKTIVNSSTDPNNNIEQIKYKVPEAGTYYLYIISEDSQYLAAEPYALISSHNLTKLNPTGPRIVYYSLSPELDVDLGYFFFKSFDTFEKISLYIGAFDEDGISYGTFNMPIIRSWLYSLDLYLPMIQIFPNLLYFNIILENLFTEQGLNRLNKILIDGSIWTTFRVVDAHPIAQSSSSFYVIINYHGFMWNLSIYALILLCILIIVDFVREKRAKRLLLEMAEEQAKKEFKYKI